MKNNLTLTLNKDYFKYIIHSKVEYEEGQLSPRVKKLRGVLKVDSDFNYKDVLNEARGTKHGL